MLTNKLSFQEAIQNSGKPAILAYTLAVEAKKLGIDPIIHFTCKDKKRTNKQEKMKDGYIPPCNWELYRTSSWLNYFNDRDYTSKHKTREGYEAKKHGTDLSEKG